MLWLLSFVTMLAASAVGSPTNASEVLHNHAPHPVYSGSRTQESAYQDYLAQFAQLKKDKAVMSETLSKIEGNHANSDGSSSTVITKKKPKKKPTSPGPPMYDYGYSDDMDSVNGKSFYLNGRHKYSSGSHKVTFQQYFH